MYIWCIYHGTCTTGVYIGVNMVVQVYKGYYIKGINEFLLHLPLLVPGQRVPLVVRLQ